MRDRKRTRGFTLIASLLLLLLLSGVSIGLLMIVNTESRVGANDVENSLAYRSAEGTIEQMTSNLAATYQNLQAPQPGDITSLNALQPTIPGITFPPGGYTYTPRLNPDGTLVHNYGQVHSGPNAGLYAMITPIDLAVTADRPWGDEVRMMRTVEAAQIPVFQFGVFSDSDLSFFNSPTLDFNGRVHTNGDLYLGVSTSSTLTFHDKMTVFGNVIRMVIPNGTAVSGNDGNVYIPTISGGCPGSLPACRTMSTSSGVYREGSVTGDPQSGQNSGWKTISTGASPSGYNGYILDGNYGNTGGTGAKQLSLPFVSGNSKAYEIIRRLPKAGQPATGADPSRLAFQAQIRVLLSDSGRCTDNHFSDWNGNAAEDVILDGRAQVVNGVGTSYFAMGNQDTTNGGKTDSPDWVRPLTTAGAHTTNKTWPLVQGCLTVEVQRADGKWYGVTNEWLQLGFARGLFPPASAGPHPNAILVFQMIADRNDDGDTADSNESTVVANNVTSAYNWFPINFYDAREGEVRDWLTTAEPAAGTCSINGVMNAVELDVFNLRKWLKGNFGGTGNLVDYASQNGYVLYYSDRRGMLPDPFAVAPEPLPPNLKGDYGFEDTINTASNTAGTPDGAAEPVVNIKGQNWSPEDTNQNGRLDKYGATNLALGFGPDSGATFFSQVNANPAAPNPLTVRVNCLTTARKNWVSGARHVLKLTDGQGQGASAKLPVRLVANADGTLGGFTVGSENPVYIQGDYNTSSTDPMWTNPTGTEPAHSAAAIIADSVVLLSNQWQDVGISGNAGKLGSLAYPFDANVNRPSVSTYYRVAIAAGKTINFPKPGFANAGTYYGTDGGLHNFLRFLESWNGDNLYYKGSLVSLFYSTYNTGTFKCCQYMVYQPPIRNYVFDPLFQDPKNLPPGTPMFRDINNLTYRQDFTPH
jgi:type II secretory pathway pseudopilin PulG